MIEKIKSVREEKGISRYKLSQMTGISESTLSRYERGLIRKISIENLKKICKALEIDISKII